MDAAQESVSAPLQMITDSSLISLSLPPQLQQQLQNNPFAALLGQQQGRRLHHNDIIESIMVITLTPFTTYLAPPNPGPAAPQGTTNTSPLPNPWAPPGSSSASSVPRTTGTSSSTTTSTTSQSQQGGAGQRGQSGSAQQQPPPGGQGMFGVSV